MGQAFTNVPWGLFSEDDVLPQSGMADTWDDARLAMIENLYPPSGEQYPRP